MNISALDVIGDYFVFIAVLAFTALFVVAVTWRPQRRPSAKGLLIAGRLCDRGLPVPSSSTGSALAPMTMAKARTRIHGRRASCRPHVRRGRPSMALKWSEDYVASRSSARGVGYPWCECSAQKLCDSFGCSSAHHPSCTTHCTEHPRNSLQRERHREGVGQVEFHSSKSSSYSDAGLASQC